MIETASGLEIFAKNSKFLVVDDHDTTRMLVSKMLEKAGYSKIHQAMGGVNGWDKLMAAMDIFEPYDVAILDWHMPDMNGLELLKKIRGDSQFKGLPMMFLTGENSAQSVKDALKEGIDAYILKPFSYTQLVLGLHNLCKKSKSL